MYMMTNAQIKKKTCVSQKVTFEQTLCFTKTAYDTVAGETAHLGRCLWLVLSIQLAPGQIS